MSLDQNLFTLNVTPHPQDPSVLDLVDPAGNAHYRKQRVAGTVYKMNVYGASLDLLQDLHLSFGVLVLIWTAQYL